MSAANLIALKDDIQTAIDASDWFGAHKAIAKFAAEYHAIPSVNRSSMGIQWGGQFLEEMRKSVDVLEKKATNPTGDRRGRIQRQPISRVSVFTENLDDGY